MRFTNQFALALAIGCSLSACGGGSGSTKPAPVISVSSFSSLTATSQTTSASSLSSASVINSSSSKNSSSLTTSAASSSTSAANTTSFIAPPSVDAGKDQTVLSGSSVSLMATLSGDAPAPLTYQWTQISGTAIALTNATSASASFTAPAATTPFSTLFKVSVTDKNGVAYSDTVAISISSANIRYEAEDLAVATLANGAKVDSTLTAGRSGTGYVNGFTNDNPNATLTWSIAITEAAYYKVDLGFQLNDSPKGFDFVIDGTTQLSGTMTAADKNFHATSLGHQWLTAGTHTFTVKNGWRYYNIDYLEFTKVASPVKPQTLDPLPVDSAATAKAKALKKYINDNYTNKTLSGQHNAAEIDTIFTRSGQRPAIYAIDLLNYSSLAVKSSGSAPASETENFIEKVKNTSGSNRYIASLIWHWQSPVDAKSIACSGTGDDMHCWWNSFYTAHTNFDLAAALADPTGDKYKALIADIDLIAVQLKKVDAAGIPVLWRPLHEADGAWFWWGAKGPESFKKLWRIMYDRLTNYHQIHNLIWVLTNETPSWYPGDDVVDVVGIDAYPTDKHDALTVIWEKMLERYDGHKIIALTEFGGVPFINEMQAKGVWWAWFASWNDTDSTNPLGPKKMTVEEVNTIYNSPEVISLDELAIPAQ